MQERDESCKVYRTGNDHQVGDFVVRVSKIDLPGEIMMGTAGDPLPGISFRCFYFEGVPGVAAPEFQNPSVRTGRIGLHEKDPARIAMPHTVTGYNRQKGGNTMMKRGNAA